MKRNLTTFLLLVFIVLAQLLPASGCTIFMVKSGHKVLVGNNEDFWYSVDACMWFVPATKDSHGRVLFGWDKSAQGGMNDQGLFFDAATSPEPPADFIAKQPPAPKKPVFKGNIGEELLAKCATADEAAALIEQYRFPQYKSGHLLIADRNGASAVVEWIGTELKIIKSQKPAQVVTNFLLSNPEFGVFPCPRYQRVQHMLGEAPDLTGNRVAAILKSVAQFGESDGRQGGTLYSNVYDLETCEVVLFYKRNFAKPLTINLAEELRKGKHTVKLETAFKTA